MKLDHILIGAAMLALAATLATRRTPQQPATSAADDHKALVLADRQTLREIRGEL